MRVEPIGSNMTQVTTRSHIVLVSYRTPVAFEDRCSGQCYRTTEKHSRTTSKHINKWLDGRQAEEVSQDVCDNLLEA